MTREPWEGWFERYRGTELAELVLHLVRVAREKGCVTAEDCHCIPVTNPNIRGAAIRRLKGFGIIRKESVVFGSTDQSHGHTMFKWVLADPAQARSMCESIQRAALRQPRRSQAELAMDGCGQYLLAGVA